jgi:hypothetical protein
MTNNVATKCRGKLNLKVFNKNIYERCRFALMLLDGSVGGHVVGAELEVCVMLVPVPEAPVPWLAHLVTQNLETSFIQFGVE